MEPLVSICCITYNHRDFIRDALDGFLSQRTDFPYEILINDDASTDGTADIIREYEQKYPEKIRALLQTENQYSKGITNPSGAFNFPRVRGRYVAMCEGDDYWTDPEKLQKQVDYMEAHPDCSLCFHSARIITVDGSLDHPETAEILCKLPGGRYAIAADGGGHRIRLLHGSGYERLPVRRGSVLDQSGKIRRL